MIRLSMRALLNASRRRMGHGMGDGVSSKIPGAKTGKAGRGGFGTPWDMEPAWLHRRMSKEGKKIGRDRFDWFYRAFNHLRLYELMLHSEPFYWGFIIWGGIFVQYGWSKMWDQLWVANNRGKLYAHVPYAYPWPEEEE